MKAQGRVRPSKPMSAVGLIVGISFIGIGVVVVIPQAGAFGVVWTLVAVAITGYHLLNLFSQPSHSGDAIEAEKWAGAV